MRWIFFLVFYVFEAQAQMTFQIDVAKETEAESPELIKKELLFDATLKAIEKAAPDLGISYGLFDTKLNEKFKTYFESYKTKKTSEKFAANFGSDQDRKAFAAGLSKDSPKEFIEFSRALETVKSYAFHNLERELAPSKKVNARIDLTIDRIKLERLFKRITSDENKPFSRMLLISQVDLVNFQWPDFGFDNQSIFITPINASWLTWLNENLHSNIEEATLCDKECKDVFKVWSETAMEEISHKVPLAYSSSLWLKVNINLKKLEAMSVLSEVRYEWEGRMALLDIQTKKVLLTLEIPRETKSFKFVDQKTLNSALASQLYRSPLSTFIRLNGALKDKQGPGHATQLIVKGHKHMGDLMALMDLIKTRGSPLGLEVNISSLHKDEAYLTCFYQGEEKSFTDLLSSLKELKSTQSYTLMNEFTGIHHVLKLVP